MAFFLMGLGLLALAGCDDSDSATPWGTYYKEADGDFYSDGASVETDAPPAGYYLASKLTATAGDCDDRRAAEIACTNVFGR